MATTFTYEGACDAQAIERYRRDRPDAARWAEGYGRIQHDETTQARVFDLVERLERRGVRGDGAGAYEVLHAADRVASAGMWLVVHETYAAAVHLDGRPLAAEDFKAKPEGHTGGSLNMVPAYVGYLAANAISGLTRSWLMGQGHCVAAIDSVNVLVDNLGPAHAERYSVTEEGLTRYVRDFYLARLDEHGRQESPLGSHVNAHTAGGMSEGGYLGFAELQYVHMPLPGERLVAFLSDGAFEEQRGSDWTPRWWRARDCGLVAPIMIKNGRRIDQRTTMSQTGGVSWFTRHLELNGFDPIVFDGRDPAAFACTIIEMEERLADRGAAARDEEYPVRVPYGIAVAPKGAGFFNEGRNLAHNLPLPGNPHEDPESLHIFNEHVAHLHVDPSELGDAVGRMSGHERSGRPRERDHPLAHRDVPFATLPEPSWRTLATESGDDTEPGRASPMAALDTAFRAIVEANPQLRPRVGNPDEMKSNRLLETLDALRFRVTSPEAGMPEDVHGGVITALNEEAVVSAALANKGGINLTATYEAFGAKMHGAVRQEVIFARHAAMAGREQRWLSIPLVLTSHTWENAKNEQSHQDPAMAEAMLGEASDVSRVLFVPDANGATVAIRAVYRTHGQLWTLVVPKGEVLDAFTAEEAERLLRDGAIRLAGAGHEGEQRLVLTAIGAYQLEEVLRASRRLAGSGIGHSVVYLLEPGRFRSPRDDGEREHAAPSAVVRDLYPDDVRARVFVTHTRPEPMLGALHPLHTGAQRTGALGYVNHGGTLDVAGLLFVNGSSWAHVLAECARVLDVAERDLLSGDELDAMTGRRSPEGVVVRPVGTDVSATVPG